MDFLAPCSDCLDRQLGIPISHLTHRCKRDTGKLILFSAYRGSYRYKSTFRSNQVSSWTDAWQAIQTPSLPIVNTMSNIPIYGFSTNGGGS